MEFHAVKIGVVHLFPNAKEFQCVSAAPPVPRADLTTRGAARRVRGMKPVPTLYLDTSVIGGYFDKEWMNATRELWRQMELGLYRFVTSTVTPDELILAPERVRALFAATFPADAILPVTDETKRLAAAYIRQGIVPEKYADDAQHVAVCTVAGIEYLVSWNFKHLVNVERKKGFNGTNLLHGYRNVSIVSPQEFIYDDRQQTT